MKLKSTILIFLLSVFAIYCNNVADKISIVSLKMLDYTDSSINKNKVELDKSRYFLVQDFVDNKKNEAYIDSFIVNNRDKDFDKYANYAITFYKQSSKTNIKNIKQNPRVIDRYSQQNDLIFKYTWIYGKSFYKFKFKDGKIVNSKIKVKITDVP